MLQRASEAEPLPGELSRLVPEGLFGTAWRVLDVPKLRGAAAGDPMRHHDGGIANLRRAAGDPFASDWR